MRAPTRLLCLGLSHHTAPVDIREHLSTFASALDGSEAPQIGLAEWALLATCNRVEFYATVPEEADAPFAPLLEHFATVDPDFLSAAPHLYLFESLDAVRHLCRVAAGLDSLVLGEPQIHGQVSLAIQRAKERGHAGETLEAAFRTAHRLGSRARAETAINRNPMSISSVAVQRATAAIGSLKGSHAVVVGAGEMGRLALKALQREQPARLTLVNRTPERAACLAEALGATVAGLDALPAVLAEADVVFTATGAPHPLIDSALVQEAMSHRPERPLLFVDIALPRDVEPGVEAVPHVRRFDIDDLRSQVGMTRRVREMEVPKVEALIEEAVHAYDLSARKARIQPVITDLRRKAERIRRRELQRALDAIGPLDDDTAEALRFFSRSLVKKLLHDPTMRLRDKAADEEGHLYADLARHLFALEKSQPEPRPTS